MERRSEGHHRRRQHPGPGGLARDPAAGASHGSSSGIISQISYLHFADIGLLHDAPDAEVWDACQRHGLVLITDNRNEDSPDSLEATIRARNTRTTLPVLTIANLPHLGQSRQYADRVIERLLDFLERMDALRGTGRLFLP